jgi:hypothetical protein
MLQENISPHETSSRVHYSWMLDAIPLLSMISGVFLLRNRVAMISSFDTSYEKKDTVQLAFSRNDYDGI